MSEQMIPARDGTELFLRSWEPDEVSASLIIVHGISEHIGRWEHVAEFYHARGYVVHAYDHRGHGRSGGALLDVELFEHFLDDLEVVVQRVRRPAIPLVIYGHSMGGLIATLYAESTRPQPDLYVLSAPALDADVPAPLRAAAKVLPHVTPRLRVTSSIDGSHLSRDPAVGADYLTDPLVYLKPTTRLGGALLNAGARARKAVNQIRQPTLVVHGAEDPLVPPRASAPLAAAAAVERKLFPGLRHELHNEPEQDHVLAFIAEWIAHQLEGVD